MKVEAPVAEREITVLIKKTGEYKKVNIRIGAPSQMRPVSLIGCDVDWGWLANKEAGPIFLPSRCYGKDSIHAIRNATDICAYLDVTRDLYDYFLPSGEPLFDASTDFDRTKKEVELLRNIKQRLIKLEAAMHQPED